jgi:hypothetical protein
MRLTNAVAPKVIAAVSQRLAAPRLIAGAGLVRMPPHPRQRHARIGRIAVYCDINHRHGSRLESERERECVRVCVTL